MSNENNNTNVFHDQYIPSIVKWGRITNLFGVLLGITPGLVCTFVFGLRPEIGALITGFLLIASMEGVFWFVEPISYFPVLGIPGTYMSFLSGNISNLRLTVSIAVQGAAEVEPGSEKGTVISAVGIGVSVIVNILILSVGVVLGASVLKMVPESVITALTNIVPALFGALFAQQVVSDVKTGIVAAVLAIAMMLLYMVGALNWVPGGAYWLIMIIIIFGTVIIGRMMATKDSGK